MDGDGMTRRIRIRSPRKTDRQVTPYSSIIPKISIEMMMGNPYTRYRVRKRRGKRQFAIFAKAGYSKNKFEMRD
tara:strand:- start:429 stop:650 length:222 start_codon:yes stop_codon:yes gene_type:complete